jgi:hypothetical protein
MEPLALPRYNSRQSCFTGCGCGEEEFGPEILWRSGNVRPVGASESESARR